MSGPLPVAPPSGGQAPLIAPTGSAAGGAQFDRGAPARRLPPALMAVGRGERLGDAPGADVVLDLATDAGTRAGEGDVLGRARLPAGLAAGGQPGHADVGFVARPLRLARPAAHAARGRQQGRGGERPRHPGRHGADGAAAQLHHHPRLERVRLFVARVVPIRLRTVLRALHALLGGAHSTTRLASPRSARAGPARNASAPPGRARRAGGGWRIVARPACSGTGSPRTLTRRAVLAQTART